MSSGRPGIPAAAMAARPVWNRMSVRSLPPSGRAATPTDGGATFPTDVAGAGGAARRSAASAKRGAKQLDRNRCSRVERGMSEEEGAARSRAAPPVRLVRMDEPGLSGRRLRHHLLCAERADDAQKALIARRLGGRAGLGVERAGKGTWMVGRQLSVELAFPCALALHIAIHARL